MTALATAWREVIGLFVEDGSLALGVLAVVVLAGVAAALLPGSPLLPGGILLFGCLAVLVTNLARAVRRYCQSIGL